MPSGTLGLEARIGAILAMDGRKALVPSSGLAVQIGTERRIFHASQLERSLSKNLTVPVWTRSSLARKKGATATKDARYATKYLDTLELAL